MLARAERHLDAIARQVAASSRIINGLLEFARDFRPQYSLLDLEPPQPGPHGCRPAARDPVSTEIPASLPSPG